MSRNGIPKLLGLTIFLLITAAAGAQDSPDNRRELEQSLQSRYRPAVLGKGIMGIGGENTIRRAGGVVVLRRAGLWGAFDRGATSSWAIRGDHSELLTGHKDIELQIGQKFYVTSVSVGSDVVQMGLLSTGTASGGARTGRLWATAAFFFDPKVIAQGDMGAIEPAMDQWLGQGDSISSAAPAATVPAVAPATPAVAAASPSKVSIRSDPAGAEIFLDGKFIGNAPANLQLAAGTYNVSVKLQGYEPWQRELTVISGSETGVQANLEATAAK